jgi:hypothetical protein
MTITGLTPAEITVASRAYLFLAPVGTAAPTDATTALSATWKCVGLTTPDSLAFSTSPSFKEVPSGQSDYPALRFQDADAATLAVQLLQWSGANFKAVYGGGTLTEVTGPPVHWKYVPPRIGDRTEVAAITEIRMGVKRYRFIYPRVFQVEGVQLDLKRTEESRLPLSYAVLGSDDVDAWYMLTNDAAFTPPV